MPSHCKAVTAVAPSDRRKSTLNDLPKIPLQVGCRDKAGIRSAPHSVWYQEVSQWHESLLLSSGLLSASLHVTLTDGQGILSWGREGRTRVFREGWDPRDMCIHMCVMSRSQHWLPFPVTAVPMRAQPWAHPGGDPKQLCV